MAHPDPGENAWKLLVVTRPELGVIVCAFRNGSEAFARPDSGFAKLGLCRVRVCHTGPVSVAQNPCKRASGDRGTVGEHLEISFNKPEVLDKRWFNHHLGGLGAGDKVAIAGKPVQPASRRTGGLA